jgi:histone H3/H4
MTGQFIKSTIRGSAWDIARSLCPGDTKWDVFVSSESVWCQVCDCLQRPLMIIGNFEGVGVYYRPVVNHGGVDMRSVKCDIATACARTTDHTEGDAGECFALTDPAVCVIVARENDEFETLTFVPEKNIHRRVSHKIGRSDVRRLARRGGTKRMQEGITDEINTQLREYLHNLLRDTTALVEMRRKKTVSMQDVLYVLQRQGHPMYL